VVGRPSGTIYHFIKHYVARGSIENSPRCGRPSYFKEREMLICLSAVPERIEKTLWWTLPRKLMRLGEDLLANGQYKRN
jgi:transposase